MNKRTPTPAPRPAATDLVAPEGATPPRAPFDPRRPARRSAGALGLTLVCAAIAACGGGTEGSADAGVSPATGSTATILEADASPAAVAESVATIQAARSRQRQNTLSVTVDGNGTVVSDPAGIDCGGGSSAAAATACSTEYVGRTRVVLRATAAAGSVFAGWDGDCHTRRPVCRVDNRKARAVTARFALGTAPAPSPAPTPAPSPSPAPSPAPSPTPAPSPAPSPAPAPAPTPAPSPSPAPAPSPTPLPGTTADLCAGLVSDKLAHPMTQVPKPALLGSYVDPNFKTTVRRITDAAAQFKTDVVKPVYSTMPAWNANETWLLLYVPGQGHVLLDGKTYAFVRFADISPTDIEHAYWSATDPDALFYPTGRELRVYHPSTDKSEVVKTFDHSVGFGGDPIYGDWASNLFGFKTSVGPYLFNRTTGAVRNGVTAATPKITSSGRSYVQDLNVYNATTDAFVRTMTIDTTQHGSTGRLANGQDFWASVQFDLADGKNGNLIVQNIDTGVVTSVIGQANGWGYPRTGSHVSSHAFKAPGWVATSMTGDPVGSYYLDQEIALANVNTGAVCRIGHHRSAGQEGSTGYWAEPHVNISPSGTRVIFGSDWYNGTSVDTYVIELPSYKR